MEVDELIESDSSLKNDVRVFLEPQGPGIKEKFDNYDLVNQEVNIRPDDEIILIGPDNGNKGTKDEGYVPNLHNGLFRIQAYLYEHGTKSAMINADIDNMEQAWELIRKNRPPIQHTFSVLSRNLSQSDEYPSILAYLYHSQIFFSFILNFFLFFKYIGTKEYIAYASEKFN